MLLKLVVAAVALLACPSSVVAAPPAGGPPAGPAGGPPGPPGPHGPPGGSSSPSYPLRVGQFFPDGMNSIANQLGIWDKYGLSPSFTQVKGSVPAYNSLGAGAYDVLFGAIDNTFGRDINSQDSGAGLNFTVLGGGDFGPGFALWSSASITSPEQLKGKLIAVDSPTSGFVLALQKVLNLYGLQYPRDYSYKVGYGTPARVALLQQGAVDATLFTYPFDEQWRDANPIGGNRLAAVSDYIPGYQSTAFHVATANIADSSSDLYQAYVRMLAVQLEARALLAESQTNHRLQAIVQECWVLDMNITSGAAALLYADAVGPNGFITNVNLGITVPQITPVIYIRQEAGLFNAEGPYGPGNATNAIDVSRLIQIGGPGHVVNLALRDAALQLFSSQHGDYASQYSFPTTARTYPTF